MRNIRSTCSTRQAINVLLAGTALFLTIADSAEATHGTATLVDSIDGSGPGVYPGTLTNPATVDSADWFTFAANAGDNVTIAMDSDDFDAHLYLYLVAGTPQVGDDRNLYSFVAEDDDGGVGLNSLISIPSLAAGNYIIAAESISGENQPLGAYNLTVSGNVHAIPEPSSIVLLSAGALTLWVCLRRRR